MNHLQASRISERSADPAPIELSSRLIGAGQGISTLVEMPLQINLFMQNKPNVKDAQINVISYIKSIYEKLDTWLSGKNKPNSNPIKPNLQKAKMNVNLYVIEDYRKKDDFSVRINKPNLVRRRRIANELKITYPKIWPHPRVHSQAIV